MRYHFTVRFYVPPAYSPAAGAVDELGMFIARSYRCACTSRIRLVVFTSPIDASSGGVKVLLVVLARVLALVLKGSCRIAKLKSESRSASTSLRNGPLRHNLPRLQPHFVQGSFGSGDEEIA